MKSITIIFSIIFSIAGYSQYANLVIKKRVKKVEPIKKDEVKRRQSAVTKKKKRNLSKALVALRKENQALKKLALTRLDSMDMWESGPSIRRGDRVGGTLELSVLSTNMGAPVIFKVSKKIIPEGGEVHCTGSTKHKRVYANCYALITPFDDIEISATILEADGSHGMMGVLSTGKENYIAGIMASEMAQGMLAVAQDRTQTAHGSVVNATSKNMALQGLVNTGGAVSEIMKEEMTTTEPKVFVKRGKRVIIYFNRTVKTSQGDS